MSNITIREEIQVTVATGFTTRLVDEFIQLKCSPELLPLFPNVKEITESMAVFNAIRRVKDVYPIILGDPSVLCVVPGDGVSPRTGALAAYRTKWNVHSIGPRMRPYTGPAKRLTCTKAKIEDVKLETDGMAVILSTHSHALLDNVIKSVKAGEYIVVAMQCCVDMYITGQTPIFQKRDAGCFSPENLVKVWRFKAV